MFDELWTACRLIWLSLDHFGPRTPAQSQVHTQPKHEVEVEVEAEMGHAILGAQPVVLRVPL